MAQQLNLFTQPTLSTLMRDIKISMNEVIRASGKSREQVLDLMNSLAARHGMRLNGRAGLSKETFEKWLNAEDESRNPTLKGITVFCAATSSTKPLASMVLLLGAEVIEGPDIPKLEWARRYHQAKDLRKEMRQLEEKI